VGGGRPVPVVDVLDDRYELGSLLGRGATSRVVRARDRRLGREVAVKIIDVAAEDQAARARFVREVQSSGQLVHPNVVTVYDAGDTGDSLFIAMALVDGEDLASRLRGTGALVPDEAVRIGVEVLHALEAAHDAGIVHRDVKPSNVLLGPDGSVQLADFGIAKPLDDLTSGLTTTGQIIGTASYLSPEQVASQPLSPATDLYALGVVLYEALSGTKPFVADTAVAVALAHQTEEPPPLVERAPHVDPALAAVVHRALQKRPEDRFPTPPRCAPRSSRPPTTRRRCRPRWRCRLRPPPRRRTGRRSCRRLGSPTERPRCRPGAGRGSGRGCSARSPSSPSPPRSGWPVATTPTPPPPPR
jgi:eukaryotic-like serine/threonine-protein kinase